MAVVKTAPCKKSDPDSYAERGNQGLPKACVREALQPETHPLVRDNHMALVLPAAGPAEFRAQYLLGMPPDLPELLIGPLGLRDGLVVSARTDYPD
jgi:hypothetical protein